MIASQSLRHTTQARPVGPQEEDSGARIRLTDHAAGEGPLHDAPEIVDALIAQTFELGASDLHLLPTRDGLRVCWRIDGVLHHAGDLPAAVAPNVVTRLKVLADLLTYESQNPQEGRLKSTALENPVRISTFPTVYGEKVVARVLQAGAAELGRLSDLQLPAEAQQVLSHAFRQTSGAILIVGPAGSGKTTTAYAIIREIVAQTGGARSIATLEDPVEVVLEGVTQSQAAPHAGFDLQSGLRALVRQDPEVILVGEIRDAETARLAYQAALTGQLVVTTFHASDVATAVSRLLDMDLPPYVLRGATRAIAAQRLVRSLCECSQAAQPQGCPACRQTGYRGRRVLAEAVDFTQPAVSQLLAEQLDRQQLQEKLLAGGLIGLRQQAERLVSQGETSLLEIERVLGC
ncbi:MAG: Flp pilus assembly complex ATPase component TadA [Planctomycetales bacterium]|nr:Flp pilus assembly complex ATPase component TadA [Planctomycetales bacterium]